MRVTTLKKELHQAIDSIRDENLLEAVYTILNRSLYDYKLTKEQKKELISRLKKHEQGDSQNIPWKRSLKSVRGKIRK
ncbi:MAG: hypothetical protein AB1458_16835 [Bacteroidota bacterium]